MSNLHQELAENFRYHVLYKYNTPYGTTISYDVIVKRKLYKGKSYLTCKIGVPEDHPFYGKSCEYINSIMIQSFMCNKFHINPIFTCEKNGLWYIEFNNIPSNKNIKYMEIGKQIMNMIDKIDAFIDRANIAYISNMESSRYNMGDLLWMRLNELSTNKKVLIDRTLSTNVDRLLITTMCSDEHIDVYITDNCIKVHSYNIDMDISTKLGIDEITNLIINLIYLKFGGE